MCTHSGTSSVLFLLFPDKMHVYTWADNKRICIEEVSEWVYAFCVCKPVLWSHCLQRHVLYGIWYIIQQNYNTSTKGMEFFKSWSIEQDFLLFVSFINVFYIPMYLLNLLMYSLPNCNTESFSMNAYCTVCLFSWFNCFHMIINVC